MIYKVYLAQIFFAKLPKYRVFMINSRGYYLKKNSEYEATIRMRLLLE